MKLLIESVKSQNRPAKKVKIVLLENTKYKLPAQNTTIDQKLFVNKDVRILNSKRRHVVTILPIFSIGLRFNHGFSRYHLFTILPVFFFFFFFYPPIRVI